MDFDCKVDAVKDNCFLAKIFIKGLCLKATSLGKFYQRTYFQFLTLLFMGGKTMSITQ